MRELLNILNKCIKSVFSDIYTIFAAILLYHFGATWFICGFLFLFGELCELLSSFFLTFFFLGLALRYRNVLFSIYENFFLPANVYFNFLLLFFKKNIFFKNLIILFNLAYSQFKNFFFKK